MKMMATKFLRNAGSYLRRHVPEGHIVKEFVD
jgi:hypothetical protein